MSTFTTNQLTIDNVIAHMEAVSTVDFTNTTNPSLMASQKKKNLMQTNTRTLSVECESSSDTESEDTNNRRYISTDTEVFSLLDLDFALAFDLALVESTKYASSENESNHSETETEACKTSPDTDSDMESDEEFSEHTSMPYDTQSIATTKHNLGAFSFGFEDPMEDGRPDQGYFCGDASLPKFLGA